MEGPWPCSSTPWWMTPTEEAAEALSCYDGWLHLSIPWHSPVDFILPRCLCICYFWVATWSHHNNLWTRPRKNSTCLNYLSNVVIFALRNIGNKSECHPRCEKINPLLILLSQMEAEITSWVVCSRNVGFWRLQFTIWKILKKFPHPSMKIILSSWFKMIFPGSIKYPMLIHLIDRVPHRWHIAAQWLNSDIWTPYASQNVKRTRCDYDWLKKTKIP